MNTRLTDAELAALDRYQPAWYADALDGRAEAGSAVSDVCGPLNDDNRQQRRSMEGLVVAIVLSVAILGTVAIIHFAARYFQ